MQRCLIVNLAILTGLWLVLLAGLGALPDRPSARPPLYAHTGNWVLYEAPEGQASRPLRDLRPI